MSSSHHHPTMFPAAMVDMISMGSSHPTFDTWTTQINLISQIIDDCKPHPETVEPVLGISGVVAESVDRPAHQPHRPQH